MNEQILQAIAAACHEVNRTWCIAHGDNSQKPWFDAEEWQRKSAVDGVIFALTSGKGPEAQHQAWCDSKRNDGWRFGVIKDAEAKTHPCLVPYEELPAMQRVKDDLFINTVLTMFKCLTPK